MAVISPVRVNLKKPNKPAVRWINFVKPTKREIKKIQDLVRLPADLLLSLSDIDEIPMVERHPGCVFLIIRVPHKTPRADGLNYASIPLGIIISSKHLITVSYFRNEVTKALQLRTTHPVGIQFALQLLLDSAKLYLRYLKEINIRIYEIQQDLQKSTKNREIIKLLSLEKSLVYFSTALKSNALLLEKLGKNHQYIHSAEERGLAEDVMDETKQAIEMADIYSNILSSMMDAFASIISNNLNIKIKTLTSLTIIVMVPTLIASIYGMNINLPFQHHPHSFAIVMGISVFISLVGIVIFWRRELF